MDTEQNNKKIYIGGIIGILVILLIIGMSYNNSPENAAKKDEDNTNSSTSATKKDGGNTDTSKNGNEDTSTNNDLKLSSVNFNSIYSIAFLVIFWGLYEKMATSTKVNNGSVNDLDLGMNTLSYSLFGLLLIAMVVYIGCFASQNHKLDLTLGANMLIFAFMPVLHFVLIMGVQAAIDGIANQFANFNDFSNTHPTWNAVLLCLISSVIAYDAGKWFLEKYKPNTEIKLSNGKKYYNMQWLFHAFLLTFSHHIIHVLSTGTNDSLKLQWLLWVIPVCYLYVQAYWCPNIPYSGYEIIDGIIAKIEDIIAFTLNTFNLWLTLGFVMIYHNNKLSGGQTSLLWLIWMCFSYAYLRLGALSVKVN